MKQKSDYIATTVIRICNSLIKLINFQDARWKDAIDENGKKRFLNSKQLLIDQDNEMEIDGLDCTEETIGDKAVVTNAGTYTSTIPVEGSKQKKERSMITVSQSCSRLHVRQYNLLDIVKEPAMASYGWDNSLKMSPAQPFRNSDTWGKCLMPPLAVPFKLALGMTL